MGRAEERGEGLFGVPSLPTTHSSTFEFDFSPSGTSSCHNHTMLQEREYASLFLVEQHLLHKESGYARNRPSTITSTLPCRGQILSSTICTIRGAAFLTTSKSSCLAEWACWWFPLPRLAEKTSGRSAAANLRGFSPT